MQSKNILILHGFGASSQDHWFFEAKKIFQRKGHQIFIPDLPGGYFPHRDEWVETIEEFNPDESWVLIGHSLGGIAILRYLEKAKKEISQAILAATPFYSMNFN